MRISVQTLLDHRACKGQVELFTRFLGKRKFILDTPRNIRLASKFGIAVRWAIEHLGTPMPDGPLEDSDGNIRWYLHGQLHRESGPAITTIYGTEEWWLNGQLHREGGSAVIRNRSEEWWLNGQRHRESGPAIIWESGTKEWYLNGQRHREDGPAITRADGTKEWYLSGQRHRVDGPAIVDSRGTKKWYRKGRRQPDQE